MDRHETASQEVTQAQVASWGAGLEEVERRIGPRFARSEQRRRVRTYLEGLLSPVERKNGWQLAEHAGEATPYGMQRLLAGRWGQPRADAIAAQVPSDAWQRLSAGDGAKGPRLYDWVRVPLARVQLSAEEQRWEHWLLVRRSLRDPAELAYYVVFALRGTPLRDLVQVAGQRWRIEQSFELAKGEVGLDQYEVRR